MIYLFSLITAWAIGTLTLRLIVKNRLSDELTLFLGSALGLGIVGQSIFYLQLVAGNFNHFLPPLLSLLALAILFWLNKKGKKGDKRGDGHFKLKKKCPSPLLLSLLVLIVPLWLEANFFNNGGWDAWSCWNLKAKFIYFGQESWKDMFSPILWRSNTGYPLALPTINVWFWQWSGFSSQIPLYTAIILTLLTAGVLLSGLQTLGVSPLKSTLTMLTVFTLPFGNSLFISQYSDILFSLYLLCIFVSYLLYEKLKDNHLLILTALFIGLLSFTKNEGLAASFILSILILLQKPSNPWRFISIITLAALPTIIFAGCMAPHSEAFINGLFSPDKPSTISRFLFILVNMFYEFIGFQWMGLWILAIVGLILAHKNAFKKPLVLIGVFLACYLAITVAYYQINTFFDNISWWMNFTLNRIIFALMPSVFLWMGVSLFNTSTKNQN